MSTQTARSLAAHPPGFWFIFSGELAERSSYYGMRAILALYMTKKLGFSEGAATQMMALFIAACYLLPLIGGWVADNVVGKYWTIVGFSIPYILGHVILGFESRLFLYIALGLLAMGTGVIKPNISTLMGLTYDQFRPGQEQLRSDAFAMFYGAINIGASLSSFAMPIIRNRWDYWVAFLFPAALMVLAFLFFAAGKPFYAKERVEPRRKSPAEKRQLLSVAGIVVLVCAGLIGAAWWSLPPEHFVTAAAAVIGIGMISVFLADATAEQREVLRRLLGMFLVISFFWSIFDQSPSTWTLFAKDHLQARVFDYGPLRSLLPAALVDYELAPDQLQTLNPVLIILLLPVVTILWRVLPRYGINLRPTSKMLIGFVLTGLSMAVLAVAAYVVGETGKLSVLWWVVAYLMVTTAEICISVVGLELSYAAAPKEMKSFVSACWLLAVFFGNIFNAMIGPWYGKQPDGSGLYPAQFFALLALLMIPVTFAFVFVAWRFNRTAPTPEVEQMLVTAA